MKRRFQLPIVLTIVWLAVLAGGFAFLLNYKATPGKSGKAPSTWPAQSSIQLDLRRLTLVMLAHPRCPCTAASLDGLTRIHAEHSGRVAINVLFLQPDAFPEGWEQSTLWKQAVAIPGSKALADRNGSEAECFGATTSGQVLVFHPDGRLLFDGGITSARGHAGDSPGLDALAAVLAGSDAAPSSFPVFGCPLQTPCPFCEKEGS